MKLRLLYFLAFCLLALYVLQSNSTGVAANQGVDRSGSPISNGVNCSLCHGGAFNNAAMTITVFDAGGQSVTEYRPGDNYTVEFDITNNFGFTYGMQAVALSAGNVQAGNFFSPGTNTKITPLNGRQYVEQSSTPFAANGYTFTSEWTAPAIGTGNVTIYAAGVVGGGNNAPSSDDPIAPLNIVLTERVAAAINYTQATYCQNDFDPSPNQVGATGGTYTASPSSLVIDPNTGVIDLDVSPLGNYTITYTYSAGTVSDQIAIIAADDASYSYAKNTYCLNEPNPTPTITGLGGGYFLGSTNVVIDSFSGTLDIAATGVGTHLIGYFTQGPCPEQSYVNITITNSANANFSYPQNNYCQNDADPTPTAVTTGGTYSSSPSGLAINATTGQIDVSASAAGNYTITYVTGGSCSNSSNQSVSIAPADNATFLYGATSYCVDDTDPTPTVTGLAGGQFSSTTGIVVSPSTGTIDLSASTPGTYTVTYTTNGACPNSRGEVVTVIGLDNAGFNYSNASYCQNGVSNPLPTVTGAGGGSFIANNNGLSINAGTGRINLSNSTPGNYVVTYTTAGQCPNSSTQNVAIAAPDDASFTYAATSYCLNGNDPSPIITGVTTGAFSGTSGLSINANTGVIDLSASTTGNHVITYTTSGNCPNSATFAVSITPLDNAGFNYASNSYCQNGTVNPSPTITGLAGGSFTTSPAGLVINPNTGQLNLSASNLGTYTITYTTNGTCPNSSSSTLSITAPDNANFTYAASSYCQGTGTNPTPTITGLSGGSFASTSGLVINGNTGTINLNASTAGTYTVVYTTNGNCPNTTSQNVVIRALDNAAFTYSSSSYCRTAPTTTPTVTGLTGGTFSSTAGLSLNASTGAINPSASTVGTYTVTYTTNGACPNSSTQTVAITATANSSFAYANASYCENGSNPTPTVTGSQGGTFSSTNGLAINPNTGVIDLSNSTPNTYTVTYTVSGTCGSTSTQTVTVTPLDNGAATYPSSAYCQTDPDPSPTTTGTSGGSFSSSAGLVINSNTGVIDVSASTAGTYSVTYTTNGPCPRASVLPITINAASSATFAYANAMYCQSANNPTPTITGTSGGSFSSTTGLVINSNTGQLNLAGSTAGTYVVTYTVSGTCGSSSSQTVTINAVDDANFAYAQNGYCQTDADPTPTTALAGGTFSSTAGLVINSSTGLVDLSASSAGSYAVTYTTNGMCPNSSVQTLVVNAAGPTSFAYANASYCENGSNPTPTVTGSQGGTFSSTNGLAINSNTGVIDLSNSTPNTYTVTYTVSGTCGSTSTQTVTVTPLDNGAATYPSSAYCQTDPDPSPATTGTSGGSFSSSAGLVINSNTGVIDVSASTAGTYNVTYMTNGPCPRASVLPITINAASSATFAYANAMYCQSANNPTPTITGTSGGSFSSTTGLVINSNTGQLNLAGSTAGTYVITYTVSGTCGSSSSQTVTINAVDDANFAYAQNGYCQTDADPTPTTALAGGTFSSTAGLVINSSTGLVDLSASSAGSYAVTYTTNGMCPNSSVQTLVVNAAGPTSFSYSSGNYCQSVNNPTPTVTGSQGGVFSSTNGLAINNATGEINLINSTPGTYTVTYTVSGNCGSTSTQTVTVAPVDDANFAYGQTAYCQTDTDPTPTVAVTGGTFSSTAGLVLNSATGEIDLSVSSAGTYTITYTTNGTCPNSATRTITINATGNTSFAYSSSSYCQSVNNPTPTVAGSTGGTFSSTAGLVINSTTGEIDLPNSTPGTYTVTYTVSGACGSTSTQSVAINAVDDANFAYGQAGYCQTDADPTPTRVTTGGSFTSTGGLVLNGTTGQVDVSASNPGTYTITYTTNGVCPSSSTVSLSINATGNTSFAYSNASYCQSLNNPTPTVSGSLGGTFSSTAGLAINPNTGEINLNNTTPGTYTITYTVSGTCGSTSTQTVTVNATDNANFAYSQANYCQTDNDPTPTLAGTANGLFSSNNGLAINAGTGAIDLSASTPGTYVVTFNTNSSCPSSATQTVVVLATDNAAFAYPTNGVYCQNASDPTPTVAGSTGGQFSSTAGLVINSSTGEIDLGASTVGTYTVTYATNGNCPNSSTENVTINAADNATFTYSNNSYCQTDTDPLPTVTGTMGGTYSSTAGLALNATTGEIDLSASTPNTYTITYTTGGVCPSITTQSLVINAAGTTSITYNSNSYCQSTTDPIPTITGVTGGQFSSTAGLVINSSTGEIDVSASNLGTYTVSYTVGGPCGGTSTTAVTINSIDDASFSYSALAVCQDGNDPTVTSTGTTGGTFTSTNGLSINATTGTIDASASTPGTYSVTYTTTGICANSSSLSVFINANDDASFAYNAASTCTGGSDLAASILGTTGGIFGATPTGLGLNTTTGFINASSSAPGTYTVTYETNGTCPSNSAVTITIAAPDNSSFSYGGAAFCQNLPDPVPSISQSGGTFTATPAGLDIDPLTGVVDLSNSAFGNYSILYTTNGTCPDSSTQPFAVINANSGAFTYSSSAYCQNISTNPIPTITGAVGGIFRSSPGLVIDSLTGEINLGQSSLGSYVITYTVTTGCPDVGLFIVNILAQGIVSFGYTDTVICLNAGNPRIPLQTANLGTFSATPAGMVFVDATTGVVDAANTTPGTYTVQYTTNGNCPTTRTVTVKAEICTGVRQLETADNYNLYPNPNEGAFLLTYEGESQKVAVTVLDMLGKVAYYQEVVLAPNSPARIALPNVTAGAYSVRLQTKTTVSILKMVVAKP